MRKRMIFGLLFLLGMLLFSVCPCAAVTEVSSLEPSGSTGWGLLTGITGGNWTGFQDALIEARKKGETEVTFRLDIVTYQDFADTDHIWYYAARAGVRSAECTYWSDRRVRLSDIEWWPWPMYLVHSREDFMEAVRLQKDRKDGTFGLLPDEELFLELLEDDLMRDRLEYRSGLTGYETMYYGENECALWYPDPRIEETVYIEVSGLAACADALRETVCKNSRARTVLAMDGLTYERLAHDDSLNDDVLSAAGLCGGYQSSDRARTYVFPVAEEACYPGFLISEAVRLDREKELSLVHKLVLSRAREMVRDVRGTDLEKAAQLHDLLCSHITYTVDENTDTDDCCVGAILNGKANCDGYADAFALCASLCGLNVRYFGGDSLTEDTPDEEAGHLWNLILLDGTWRSIDLTWDDQEEDGLSYEYFNIGLDRMEQEYRFTRELLPAPFAGATDLSARPVREWEAKTREELETAVREILSSGQDEAVVRLSQDLFDRYQEDAGVITYALSSAGAEAEEIWYSVSSRTVTLEGLCALSSWAFCRTGEEIAEAVERLSGAQASFCTLTLERELFAELFADKNLTAFSMLLAKGGIFGADMSWRSDSCTVTLEEAQWRTGWYAEEIESSRQLSQAVREGRKQGCRSFYLCLSQSLYEAMMADTSRLSRAVQDGGFRDSWSYYHWDDRCSVYIVGDGEERQ